MSIDSKYTLMELGKLVGGTITGLVKAPVNDFGEIDCGFKVKLPDRKEKVVWILRDQEGNGPGTVQVTEAIHLEAITDEQ